MDNVGQGPRGSGAQVSRRQRAGKPLLRLSTFDWSGFVGDHFSLTLAGGTLATGIGLVLIDPADWPKWFVFAVPLTELSLIFAAAALVLAFTRVWKTVREEHETSGLWGELIEDVSPRGTGMENVKDAVFETPYLFAILILPFSVVSFQTFALCLVLFYACDNYYNLALVRKIGTDHCARLPAWLEWLGPVGHRLHRAFGGRLARFTQPASALLGAAVATACSVVDPDRNTIDRVVLMRFFGRRARLDRIAIWLLLAAFIAVTALALLDQREWALVVGLLTLVAVLAMELVVEPFRALGMQYQPASARTASSVGETLLWSVPRDAFLDLASLAALEEIHTGAFPPAERQYSVEDMLNRTGRGGFLLLLLTESDAATEAHVVAGYAFIEVRPQRNVAYLWYLAIAEDRRGQGLGQSLVTLALDVVHDRWPSVRAVFLETSRPAAGEAPDAASDEMRRVRFYQHLGFSWVRGLEYEIPANGDVLRSLQYDPMFRPLPEDRDMDDAFIKDAVLEMARDNFEAPRTWPFSRAQPEDGRWKNLVASTDKLAVTVP